MTNIIVVSEENATVVDSKSVEIIAIPEPSIEVADIVDSQSNIIEIGKQGPPGPRGLKGASGASIVSLIAGENLGGNRVVINQSTYADNTNLDHIGKVIGITTGAANAGDYVSVQTGNELEGFFGLSLGPVYLSTNGTITQTPPTVGFIQQLGTATSSTSMIINISTPILLQV